MQKKVKFTGIVLKSIDYQDNAQIVYLLTEDSLQSVMVRGAKKIDSKTRQLAQIITKIEGLRTDNGNFSTLTEAIVVNNYNLIKEDYIKSQIVMCIFDKIYHLNENITTYITLYNFLEEILEKISTSKHPLSLLLLFEIKFWYLLGINPVFTTCVKCQKIINSGKMSIKAGGFLCNDCSSLEEYDLEEESSQILKYLYYIKMEKVDEKFLILIEPYFERISKMIDDYYNIHLDFSSKCKEIFYQVIK